MSKSSTSFRVFHPDTNAISALALFDATGASLTPASLVDGTDNPAGFLSKVVTFAAGSEPLFATPTFTNPAAPVAVYLTRVEGLDHYQVIDESLFDSANPGRPTPAVTAAQEFLLYETLSNSATTGGSLWTVKAPAAPVSIVKARGKDPITGESLEGNDILFRWQGKCPTLIQVEADVEDITDPRGWVPVELENVTTYAESSVGLSLVQSLDQIVPRDGMGHAVGLRMRYNVSGDPGAWVTLPSEFFQFDMAAPMPCVSLSSTLLRDRQDVISDLVELHWVKDPVSPGTGVEIFVTDFVGKKHSVYSSNGAELSVRLENISRFVVQDEGPAVARPYRFHIVATNLSAKSSETYASPINITSKVKAVVPPTPDEVAGTARDVLYAVLKAEVFADVLTALGALPTEGQTIVNSACDNILLKVKDVIAKGGSVALDDFGVFAAKWTSERLGRNPSNGEPVITPAYRSLGFAPSTGFKAGVKAGSIMTDAQAKAAA
ncbi:MAG: HU family DNA-binding protein [Chromatiaceae bacterium]|nr:HU family DNA-binding protein [Chromatiaceae bacterium]MBP6733229.1 HU family DNA-binding protein [Chromatiaceae bacterium]MBP6806803.1 HU family DNA-binding protein [Chromatiaceae bacterium]MBP8288281.1 HU family DNA-binding protein [Chromatiaceae bacterium]